MDTISPGVFNASSVVAVAVAAYGWKSSHSQVLDVSKKLEEVASREAKARTDLQDLESRLEELKKENIALEEKRKAAMAQTERSYRQLAQMDRKLVERERQLQEVKTSSEGDDELRAQLLVVETELADARAQSEEAFQRYQALESAKSTLDQELRNRKGQLETLLAKVTEIESLSNATLAKLATREEENARLMQEQETSTKEMETLRGSLYNSGQMLLVAEAKHHDARGKSAELAKQVEHAGSGLREATLKLSSLETEINAMSSKLSASETLRSTLEAQIKHHQDEASEFKIQIATLEHQFSEAEKAHQHALITTASISANVADLQAKNLALAEEKAAAHAHADKTNGELKELRQEVDAHAALVQEHVSKKDALEAEIAALNANGDAVSRKAASDLADVITCLDTSLARIAALETEKEALVSSVDALEAKLAENEEGFRIENQALEEKLSVASSALESERAAHAAKSKELEDRVSELDTTRSQLASLGDERVALAAQVEDLSARLATQTSEQDLTKAERDSLVQQVSFQQKTAQDNIDHVAKLTQELQDMKIEVQKQLAALNNRAMELEALQRDMECVRADKERAESSESETSATIATLETQLQVSSEELIRAKHLADTGMAESSMLTDKLSSANAQIAALHAELADIRRKRAEMESKHVEQGQQLEEAKAVRDHSASQATAFETEVTVLRESLETNEALIRRLQEDNSESVGRNLLLEAEFNDSKSRTEALEREKFDLQNQLNTAIEGNRKAVSPPKDIDTTGVNPDDNQETILPAGSPGPDVLSNPISV